MEGMFLDPQSLPVLGSIIAALLLCAVVAGVVAYSWLSEERPHVKEERAPLKKAA